MHTCRRIFITHVQNPSAKALHNIRKLFPGGLKSAFPRLKSGAPTLFVSQTHPLPTSEWAALSIMHSVTHPFPTGNGTDSHAPELAS